MVSGGDIEIVSLQWQEEASQGNVKEKHLGQNRKCKGPEVIQKQQEGNMKGQKHGMRVREM